MQLVDFIVVNSSPLYCVPLSSEWPVCPIAETAAPGFRSEAQRAQEKRI